MKRLALGALLLATSCGKLLGFSAPQEAVDAPRTIDGASIDGTSIDAGPPTLHVISGGTAEVVGSGSITSDPAGISCPGTCDFQFAPGTQVTLTAAASSPGAQFSGFHGGCTGGGSCTFTLDHSETVFARYFNSLNIIFTSSTQQAPGSFDVVGNADKLCDQLAGSAGLPGTYTAWLSTSTISAAQRLANAGPVSGLVGLWLRPDGRAFTNLFADLEAGHILFPPRLDERGSDVGDDAIAVTGTTGSGGSDGTPCQDWASTGQSAEVLAGEPAGGTDRWSASIPVTCNDATAHIYCLGNTFSATAVPGFVAHAPILFVTKGTITGGAGLAAADALCASEGTGLEGNSKVALMTPGGAMPVSARFTGEFISGSTLSRPDGIAVGSLSALFSATPFQAVPNVAADKSFLDVDVWVGGGGFSDFQTDCTGWTDGTSSGFGATRHAASTAGAEAFQPTACDQQEHVMCLSYTFAEAAR